MINQLKMFFDFLILNWPWKKRISFILTIAIYFGYFKKIIAFVNVTTDKNIVITKLIFIAVFIVIFFVIEFIVEGIERLYFTCLEIYKKSKKNKLEENKKNNERIKLEKTICYLTQEERELIVDMFNAAKENEKFEELHKYKGYEITSYNNEFEFKHKRSNESSYNSGIKIRIVPIFYIFNNIYTTYGEGNISFNNNKLNEILSTKDIMKFEYIVTPMDFKGYIKSLDEEFK